MKTLRTTRWMVRIRIVTGYLAIAAVTGLVFLESKSLTGGYDNPGSWGSRGGMGGVRISPNIGNSNAQGSAAAFALESNPT